MLSRILALDKVKQDMITTDAQSHAVASRIEQIKDVQESPEASQELQVLKGLLKDFEASPKAASWCSDKSLKRPYKHHTKEGQ